MSDFFARRGATYINEMNRSLGALLGIATGVLADKTLVDGEIRFLKDWLHNNSAFATAWPGDVIYQKVEDVLADGIITESERAHLVQALQQLIGGTLSDLAESKHVTQMIPFETPTMIFSGAFFCLTGDFVFAPRRVCEETISSRGGSINSLVSKKLNYLIVGGLGSEEWKHGSFGTKIEQAINFKRAGASIALVHEDHWANSLKA